MAYFAHITNGIVDQVIVIEQEMLNMGSWGDPSEWVECDKKYTKGLGRQAGIGYTYNGTKKKFISPKPYSSWVLNSDDEWEASIKKKVGEEASEWNEEKQKWEPVDKSKIV